MTANQTNQPQLFFSQYPINSDFTVVVGKKGVGKTVETKKQLECIDYVEHEDIAYGHDRAKGDTSAIIVFDVCGEYDYPVIELEDVKDFNGATTRFPVRRITMVNAEGNKRKTLPEIHEALITVLDNYSNGILCVEDVCRYFSNEGGEELIAAVARAESRGVKIITHMQGIKAVSNPDILKRVKVVRMHSHFDSVSGARKEFGDKYEMLRIAEMIVERKYHGVTINDVVIVEPDRRFFLYCDFRVNKIICDFSNTVARAGIGEYAIDHRDEILELMFSLKDDKGNRLYTDEYSAFVAWCKDKEKYFNIL